MKQRLWHATQAASLHMLCSLLVSAMAAGLVFGLWYPAVFRHLSGGLSLFFLVVSVDVVCGPLLTMVLFDKTKPRAELRHDLGLVVLIQLAALGYGLQTVWAARPLYLVQEVDRFRVIAAPDIDVHNLPQMPNELRPKLLDGPMTVGLRPPKDETERNTVMLESIAGGRDYAQRPEFYVPYTSEVGLRAAQRFKPLEAFLARYPDQRKEAEEICRTHGLDVTMVRYLPVVAREDWVALLDVQAQIIGYLKGDGF